MTTQDEVHPHLNFWDGVSIIIGIVIGVSIFKSPQVIFSNVTGPWAMIAVWTAGGVLTLIGAFCYAELATTYPQAGGDYAYLKLAYGDEIAYLFGWAQLSVVLTGSIGAMAYVFADYAAKLFGDVLPEVVWAAGCVVLLATVNVLGVRVGKTVQNALSIVKLVGLALIVLAGIWAGGTEPLNSQKDFENPSLGFAMIMVLYAYGGWNDAAFVAAEVKDRHRNMPRVLILGTSAILLIYLVVNVGYLWGLGYDGVRNSSAPAADLVSKAWGTSAQRLISLAVMVSALGAVNGLLFTGSRISASLGADHAVFAFLKRWNPQLKSPVWAIVSAAVISLVMIGIVGTDAGRGLVDHGMTAIGLSPLPWGRFGGGFDTLVAGTAPVFWTFFLLTGLSVLVLRRMNPDRPRPFEVPFFPWLPIVFCLTSVYMLNSSLSYAGQISLIGLVPLLLGVPLYLLGRPRSARSPNI